jgi:cytosine/uracil/thiamine/allantoin permease
VTNAAHFDATLAHATEGRNGYATENQRFLQVTVSGQNAQSVVVYVFHYATGIWSALMVNDGDGTYSQATATTAVTATGALQPQTFVFEIAGADRVGFLGDGNNDPTVHATCTSF